MLQHSLVTGGAGFLGSHVAQACLDRGHEVVVLDDLSGGFIQQVPNHDRLVFVRGSICDANLLRLLFDYYHFDYVYHLAAYAAEGLSHFIRNFNYNNNVVGSVNLINESVRHDVSRFIFTSSIAVYGSATPPFTEDLSPSPEDPYGIAKYAIELDIRAAHKMFGLDYVIFRPHNVYGPHQNLNDRYRNVVGIFMNQIMQGKPLTIFGDGMQVRAFSYIDDVAPHIAASAEMTQTQNGVFNIGADQTCTVNDLAKAVCKAFELPPNLTYLPARKEVVQAWSDHTRIREIFGLPQTKLGVGLAKMAEWAKMRGTPRSTNTIMIPEVSKNLPEAWHKCSPLS